jgi:hypothetical protein
MAAPSPKLALQARATIFCVACDRDVAARLTKGFEVYPHRPDLGPQPFWVCDTCRNYVGCHHQTDDPTRPLGVIPTPQLREARKHLHALIDPVWRGGQTTRGRLYRAIAMTLGVPEFHTAELRSVAEAREAYRAAQEVIAGLGVRQ